VSYVLKTVLLVEDYKDTRELMRFLLEIILGHRVTEAADGIEAVEQAKREHPDLILMDISMPEMDGIEATRLIKQLDGFENIPIVAITGHSEKYQKEALKAGVNEVVRKPVELDDLEPLLLSYLSA
jgi:CheY-like chemotaxis protein